MRQPLSFRLSDTVLVRPYNRKGRKVEKATALANMLKQLEREWAAREINNPLLWFFTVRP